MTDPDAALLRVAPDAPLSEVKRAYRQAALAHHPDQNPHPEAARHFRRLTEAYRILEARAKDREPARPRRQPPPGDRVGFVLADVQSLVRRWPADRWTQAVDGLPAIVWVASVLEVLARVWPGAETAETVAPDLGDLRRALDAWPDRLAFHPFPATPTRAQSRALDGALGAAEARLKALDRLARRK